MQRTNTFFRGFLSVHFFRHSASIAVLMLLTLGIMSFNVGKGLQTSKSHSSASSDSTAVGQSKAFDSLLVGSYANDEATIGQMFTMNDDMESFIKSYNRKEGEEFAAMKTWGKPYFDLMDNILAKNGLPVQLKYICVIESNLKANTVSHSGATGPWQLMRDEGKMFGLKMEKGFDERKDYAKSTAVAAGLLKNLYNQFGDWLLVVAAYNCGNGAMRRAIAKAGTNNYWVVQNYLSLQARNHVKKYIATHYMFEGCGGWTTITSEKAVQCRAAIAGMHANKANDTTSNTTIEIRGKYNQGVLASYLMIEQQVFARLNPGMDEVLLQGKPYRLTLPNNKLPLFLANRKEILEQSVQLFLSAAVNK